MVAALDTTLAAVMVIIIIKNGVIFVLTLPFLSLLSKTEVNFAKIRGNPNWFILSSWRNYPARNNSWRRMWEMVMVYLRISKMNFRYKKWLRFKEQAVSAYHQVLIQNFVLSWLLSKCEMYSKTIWQTLIRFSGSSQKPSSKPFVCHESKLHCEQPEPLVFSFLSFFF